MKETQSSILNELVDSIVQIPGVVAIILFGSVATGQSDEHSDLDILILFKDQDSLWGGWDAVFRKTGSTNLNIHAIPETMDELSRANPVFIEELEKYGKVLYARSPFKVAMGVPFRRPFSIVSYDLSALSYKEKMRVVYRLYESGGKGGVVGRSGSMKLVPGCVLVPQNDVSGLLGFFNPAAQKHSK